MSKIIFLGTDIHGKPSELAAKIVRDLSQEIKDSKRLSIQNRKPFYFNEKVLIVPKIFGNEFLRKVVQGILLPIYLILMRPKYDRVASFWTIGGRYHHLILKFIKLLKYEIIFTVISGYNRDYGALKFCDKIVCQSERMKKHIAGMFPNKKMEVIPPWTSLTFKKSKKEGILIPSVPYDVKDFKYRGIDRIVKILMEKRIKSKIIFRSNDSYLYFKNLKLKNTELINRILDDDELSKVMSSSKAILLIYSKDAPDMPLSAIEGLACGCSIICTKNNGLSDILKQEKCGIVVNSEDDLNRAIKEIFKNSRYNKNAIKTAEKYFNKTKNIKKYLNLINK